MFLAIANLPLHKKGKQMKYGMMICGTIGAGYDWWSGTYGTRSKDVKAYLDAHQDEEVHIAVSSPGGFVDEGLTMYQLIKDHGKVNVHILGMTASIATVLCMGAKHVDMSVGSTMLIHNASTGVTVWESANKAKLDELIRDWQKQRNDLDTIDKVIASVYAKKSGKSSDDILAQMEKANWLSPSQALELGLIDEIKDLDEEDKMRQTNLAKRFNNSVCSNLGLPPLPHVTAAEEPSKTFLEKAYCSLKEMFKNNSQIIKMKKKFLNLQTILDRKDDFEVTDEKITLTDAEMQKIEDSLVQKQKDFEEKSTALDAAEKKAKDLEAQMAEKDKDIQAKNQEIKDLKGAPGADTQYDVKPEVDSVDSSVIYNALKQVN